MDLRECPDWLATCGEDIRESWAGIVSARARLIERTASGFEYQHVSQRQFNRMLLDDKQTPLEEVLRSSTAVEAMVMYQNSSVHRILASLTIADQIAVARFLDVLCERLMKGDLHISWICMRCVIEHSAHLGRIIKQLEALEFADSFNAANKQHGEVYSILAKGT